MANTLRSTVGAHLRSHPRIKSIAKGLENRFESWRHSVAAFAPAVIKPRTYKIMIAVTADCNSRCVGCRYGREFMHGSRLPLDITLDLLDDAKEAGFYSIRLYGGEPLLHPDLPKMVEHCIKIGLHQYVTTNGVLLPQKIDDLYSAGLRDITLGSYGVGEAYDQYAQIPGLFAKVERGIATVRERYGDAIDMQQNWLLMRPSCSIEALHAAWDLGMRYNMPMRVDLIHYSLPYFDEGPEQVLQFRPDDRPQVEEVVQELLRLNQVHPDMLAHTDEGIRSIADWLLLGPDMRVPCTAYEMIWVGADGTVQMCYVTFELGNLHETRLRDLLFTHEHKCAAKAAFALDCPNCHCSSNERIMRHAPSRKKYSS